MQRFADIAPEEKARQFVDACRERGLSVTHQRMAIYGALANSEEHPSAERIFARVRQAYPTLSLATVYKTLETLEGIGLIHKRFTLADVQSAAVVGNRWWYGWGIKRTPHGWLFNISRFEAVEIQMANGKNYRIGTDEPDALLAAIEAAITPGTAAAG